MRFTILATLALTSLAQPIEFTGSGPWNLVLLNDTASAADGAVCLDGSPGGLYVKAGNATHGNRWVIHFNGGGWCTDLETCFLRSSTNLGTTKVYGPSTDLGGFDLLNATAARNPDFWGFSSAFFIYCDGASFSGDLASPVTFNDTQLYFRGFRILRAGITRLLAGAGGAPPLAAAESLILTGNSAGGLATILHADYVASRLPASVAFRAMPQVGFFIDGTSVFGTDTYTQAYANVALMQNISGGAGEQVNAACFAALPPALRWQCFMAQFTLPFVKSPILVQNSRVDNWQLRNILSALPVPCSGGDAPGSKCEPYGDASMIACVNAPATACNATQYAAFVGYGSQFMAALNMSVAANPYPDQNGGLITSCDLHDHMISGGWDQIAVGGRTMRQIVTPWLLGGAGSVTPGGYWTFDVQWPNNPTCRGPL